jgi:spermidine synthase
VAHGINTTVVELDPVVYQFAAEYFSLPAPHKVVIEDATAFVEKSTAAGGDHRKYDYIIHDVFTGGAEPIGLFTQEFLQGLKAMLTVDGVIAIVSASRCQSG